MIGVVQIPHCSEVKITSIEAVRIIPILSRTKHKYVYHPAAVVSSFAWHMQTPPYAIHYDTDMAEKFMYEER